MKLHLGDLEFVHDIVCLHSISVKRLLFPTTQLVTASKLVTRAGPDLPEDIFVSTRPAVCLALGFVSALPSGCLVVDVGLRGELSLLSRWDSKAARSV